MFDWVLTTSLPCIHMQMFSFKVSKIVQDISVKYPHVAAFDFYFLNLEGFVISRSVPGSVTQSIYVNLIYEFC